MLHPPVWHGILRSFIAWQASQRGWSVEVAEIDGGLLDATVLHHVHCRKTFPAPSVSEKPGGVDLLVSRTEAAFAWHWPFGKESGSGWLKRVTLDGVEGGLDFTSAGAGEMDVRGGSAAHPAVAGLTPGFALKLWPIITAPPENLELFRVNCRFSRGPVSLRAEGTRLTAYRDGRGQFLARKLEIGGPGFENTLTDRTGSTAWRDGRLTIANLALGRGLDLVRLTVDGARLRKRQLDWDSELHALGGSVRSQGAIRFAHGRIGLDIAGSFQQVAMRPLARMLGIAGETDGTVDQGQFSFRGNPEQWTQATISLAGQATDFRWQQRRWESLNVALIVLHERLTVRKLDLRQSRNQLSLNGECPLFFQGGDNAWKLTGFTCQVDAKLDDLHSLGQLIDPGLPEVTGRMSINGSLTSRPDGPGLDGYLNVEGSALGVAGAPLDFLRSTLLFRGEELQVADVQATRATDYLSGQGSVRIFGSPRYQGELHAAVEDLSVYHPAYAGKLSAEPLRGKLRLNWSGDGAPGAHSGAFRGSVADFAAKSGPARFSRPITLEAEGTYSPESVSFRRLALKEGVGDQRHDAIKFEGALPWTRDPAAWNAGQRLDFTKPLAVRVSFNEAPLDLIAEAAAAPAWQGAEGVVGGWLDVSGTPQSPRGNGVLQFRRAGWRWLGQPAVEAVTADVRLEDSNLRIDEARGRRAGADWRAAGSIDLHQPEHPLLDLSLRSARVPDAVDNALLHADAEISLSARGPWRQGEIGGEVRLLNGTLRQPLALGATAGGWDDLSKGLPADWASDRLALRVTAARPLRGALGGEFNPEVTIGGVGAAPLLSGRVDLRKARITADDDGGLVVESGSIFFSAGERPTLHLMLTGGALLGSVDDVWRQEEAEEPTDAGEALRRADPASPAERTWPEEAAAVRLGWR